MKKSFFNKINICSLIAIVLGVLSVLLFVVLPAVRIDLTPDAKSAIANTSYEIPAAMSEFKESIAGSRLLFGSGSYNVWIASGKTASEVSEKLAFNVPLLIGVLFMIASSVGMVLLLLLDKNNVANKIILAGYILGALIILFSPIWFYMVNPILASTRYDTVNSIYPYGYVNGHGAVGSVLGGLVGIGAATASAFTIIKAPETR